ncbi:hypothetical protein B0F90DRAFT_1803008, partial [Multifurca ochricompacta]
MLLLFLLFTISIWSPYFMIRGGYAHSKYLTSQSHFVSFFLPSYRNYWCTTK